MEARSPEEAFERFLEVHPHSMRSEFETFRDQYPHWSRELEDLWAGLQTFLQVRDSVRLGFDSVPSSLLDRAAPPADPSAAALPRMTRAGRPRRLVLAVAGAAALLLVGLGLVIDHRSAQEEQIEAERHRAQVLVELADSMRARIGPGLESSSEDASFQLYSELLVEGERNVAELRDALLVADAAALEELDRCYAELRRALSPFVGPGNGVDPDAERILAFLAGRAAVASFAFRGEVGRAFFITAARATFVSLTIVDLDTGEVNPADVRLWTRAVDLENGELGPPREILHSLRRTLALTSGDARLIAGRASGAFGELRVVLNPGEAQAVTLFLRRTPRARDQMLRFSASEVAYGSGSLDDILHHPESEVAVEPFLLDRREVGVAEYDLFLEDIRRHRREWFPHEPCPVRIERSTQDPDFAMTEVTWIEASLFCNWAGGRLPTDLEWERAAQGTSRENRRYPWGDVWDESAISPSKLRLVPSPTEPDALVMEHTAELGSVHGPARGATRDGVERMGDNVSEWTADLLVHPRRDDPLSAVVYVWLRGQLVRSCRGASFQQAGEQDSRCDVRRGWVPGERKIDIGIRRAATPRATLRRLLED